MDIPSEVVERSAKDTNNDHNDNDMSQSEMTKQQDAKCDGVVKSPDVGDDMSQDVTEVCSQEEDRTSAANSGFLTVIKMLDEMDERVIIHIDQLTILMQLKIRFNIRLRN